MNIQTTRELLIITNSLIHKYLTPEESFAVIDLNEKLEDLEKTFGKSVDKTIESFGGKKTENGQFTGITNIEGLNDSLKSLELSDLPFTQELKILSFESFNKQSRLIELNTIQLKIMKQYLIKETKTTDV